MIKTVRKQVQELCTGFRELRTTERIAGIGMFALGGVLMQTDPTLTEHEQGVGQAILWSLAGLGTVTTTIHVTRKAR